MLSPTLHILVIGIVFIAIGIYHFVNPDFFVKIMPSYIPYPKAMVFWSGVAEILGGVGIIFPVSRSFAAWGLILLLLAVFPANIEMFVKAYNNQRFSFYTWLTLLRLPFQFVLMYWIFWATKLNIIGFS